MTSPRRSGRRDCARRSTRRASRIGASTSRGSRRRGVPRRGRGGSSRRSCASPGAPDRSSIAGVGGPEAALLLTFVVHVVGVVVLIWAIVAGQDERPDWRSWWYGDDDDDPEPVQPKPGGDGLPLPDAAQSRARMRERGRLADRYPAPERRPARGRHQPRRAGPPLADAATLRGRCQGSVTRAGRVRRSATAAATRWSRPAGASIPTCRRSERSSTARHAASTPAPAVSKPARSRRLLGVASWRLTPRSANRRAFAQPVHQIAASFIHESLVNQPP